MSTTIGNLAIGLSVNTTGFAASLGQAQRTLQAFGQKMSGMGTSPFGGIGSPFGNVGAQNFVSGQQFAKNPITSSVMNAMTGLPGLLAEVGSQFVSLGATVAATAAGMVSGAAQAGIAWGVKLAADLETTRITFETLLGDVHLGRQLFTELQQFAIRTPFQSWEINSAAQQLLAMGVAADQMIPTLTALGNASAAGGKSLDELAFVFGRVKAGGQLTGRELRMLTTANIPIVRELAKVMGEPEHAVRKLVEAGQVGFNEVAQVFENLSSKGGQFFGLLEKRSQTLQGKWSTFADTFKLALAEIGMAIIEGLDLKKWLDKGINISEWVRQTAAQWKPVFQAVGDAARAMWDVMLEAIPVVQEAFRSLMEWFTGIGFKIPTVRELVIGSLQAIAIGGLMLYEVFAKIGGAILAFNVSPMLRALALLTDATIVFADIHGKLPGKMGEGYRQMAASLRQFRPELEKGIRATWEAGMGGLGSDSRAHAQTLNDLFKRARGRKGDEAVLGFTPEDTLRLRDTTDELERVQTKMRLIEDEGPKLDQNVTGAFRKMSGELGLVNKEAEKAFSAISMFNTKLDQIVGVSKAIKPVGGAAIFPGVPDEQFAALIPLTMKMDKWKDDLQKALNKPLDMAQPLGQQFDQINEASKKAEEAFQRVIDWQERSKKSTAKLQEDRIPLVKELIAAQHAFDKLPQGAKVGGAAIDDMREKLKLLDFNLEENAKTDKLLKRLADEAKLRMEVAKAAQMATDQIRQQARIQAGKVFAETQTPLQKFTLSMENLSLAVQEGGLQWDNYSLGVEKAVEELEKAQGQMKLPETMLQGSQEAVSLINKFTTPGFDQRTPRTAEQLAATIAEQTRVQEQTRDYARQTVEALRKIGDSKAPVAPKIPN